MSADTVPAGLKQVGTALPQSTVAVLVNRDIGRRTESGTETSHLGV
jgi:hypothetical protein